MKGWHWLNEEQELRDGRPAPADGEWLEHEGELRMCKEGLHWSKRVLDSLQYAQGPVLCRVETRGETLHESDKSVSRERLILWRVHLPDEVLRGFARQCALDVIHLWDAPDVVREYLGTGDESLRYSAWKSAWPGASAWTGARYSAWASAWDGARASARYSARASAWASAWDGATQKFNRRLTALVIAEAKRQGVYK